MTLVDVQLSILRGFLTTSEATEWKQNIFTIPAAGSLLEYLMNGDFEAVLRSTSELVLLAGDYTCSEGEDMEAYLERQILLYLADGEDGDRNNRELVVMVLSVSCLHMFVQSNWTGPSLFIKLSDILPSALLSSQPQSMVESIHSCLLLDGESVYSLVANPFLLLLARVILTKCSSKMSSLQLLPWWTLRYINLHQQILEACSQQLLNLALTSMEEVLKYKSLFSEQRNLSIQFHLECVYCSLAYYEYSTAKEHIKKAQELSMLDINMTGALGKRTYFQEKYLAQLILEVKQKQDQLGNAVTEPSPSPTPKTLLPKDCSLGDDTVLDKLNLAEPDQYELPDLGAEEQALILAVCTDFQKNNPVHKLTQEELLAFTSCLLSQPKFWAVEMTAVCLRTKLEKGSSRCVERAMMQMQAVADHFEDTNCPFTERLKVFYCCHAPTRWVVQKQLAALLIDLGCTSSALLIYEKLQLWEDVIVCWERLGQHGKAEELVRQELAKKETPSLYCLLGDILRDHQYYDKAWDLSGHRSARAMRSKALLHLRQKEFQQCVDCFEKAVKINALQLGVWFSLGCAYLALQSYEGAARAFQRCVGLEPDNAEAWNNLSMAYIRLRNKNKAFRTLQEAIKCNYEHWQIWENFIVVSIDIGAFSEAIKSYHRLMDLRDSYKDIKIIQILVRAVVEKLTDNQGEPAASLQPKLRELLGRVSSRQSSDPEIWRQYAVLYGGGHSALPEDNDKAQQFLSKAFRCEIQAAGWEKETCLFKNVIRRAINMGEVSISCSEKKKNSAEALQMLSSARLSLKSLLTKAKQTHTDMESGAIHADLQDDVVELEQLVTQLQELCAQLRTQSR
ncbi:tetratricopeptide repeat protein 27 [Nerophis ophidion]|uniref:tetratricopeptide repeat protein 27 n=1 Tax=Nerophis ophidion TaxID=159077 RepID=UPI002AE058DA|nr:tetratricopeptide repeat protein 27 [Nerophis ophidion]